MASSIFVVDSSPAVRRLVEQISKPEGCDVVGFQDGPAALEAARRLSPNLIIADYHLENMTFSGFCKEVHKLDNLAETYIVSLVSPADHVDENHLRSLGVKAFLNKPFQSENLIDVIKDLEAQQATKANGIKKKSRSWPPVSRSARPAGGRRGYYRRQKCSKPPNPPMLLNYVEASSGGILCQETARSVHELTSGF